eukprot:SAG25_NODE_298_length_10188_cov_5.941421_3_plen_139_part_00
MGVILLWVWVFPRESLNTIGVAQQPAGSSWSWGCVLGLFSSGRASQPANHHNYPHCHRTTVTCIDIAANRRPARPTTQNGIYDVVHVFPAFRPDAIFERNRLVTQNERGGLATKVAPLRDSPDGLGGPVGEKLRVCCR